MHSLDLDGRHRFPPCRAQAETATADLRAALRSLERSKEGKARAPSHIGAGLDPFGLALGSEHRSDACSQCGVAIRIAGTKSEDVVPGVKLVGNSWISLAAYQARGFGYITP